MVKLGTARRSPEFRSNPVESLSRALFFLALAARHGGMNVMEDWQEWQVRADEIAESLNHEVETLDKDFFTPESDGNLRAFWPRFRDLKEKVRIAPAIKLEAKLDLEKRLRSLGSRAYRAQEVTFARSGARKEELLASIATLRTPADTLSNARDLRDLRRELDRVREQFGAGAPLVSNDRQVVWDAWREASQHVWQRLTATWDENEVRLRAILDEAKQQLESSNANGAKQGVMRFFEGLRAHEAKQEAVVQMKAEAEGLRREADGIEERKQAQRATSQVVNVVPAVNTWRAEVDRNREAITRLRDDVLTLERQFAESRSILDQAMIRGNLVDKKRKLTEYERSTRALEQRIEQTEEVPLMTAG